MSIEFSNYRLGDIADVQTGPFGSQLHQKDYVDIGTPIITVEHLLDNRISHVNTPYVSDEDKERLSKYKLFKGDIVFSRVGSVDRRAYVREEENGWLFSGRCLRVRVKTQEVSSLYLSYYFGLESFKAYIRRIAVGATMPSINTQILSDIEVKVPPINVQHKLEDILDSIDEKIELNKKMNHTLEETAMTLYKHWFVDFGPFQDGEFVESDLGMIPIGWEVVGVSKFSNIIGGGTPKTSIEEYWGGEFPWISVKDLNSQVIMQTEKTVTKKGIKNSSTKLLPTFSTVISARGTIGNISITGVEMTMNQSCYAFSSPYDLDVFTYLSIKKSINNLIKQSHGSVFNTITKSTLNSLKFSYEHDHVKEFEEKVKPYYMQIRSNIIENNNLEDLRNYLLPKLLSGEVNIPEVEEAVGNVMQ
ncbi:hypothetical protein CN378_06025 [Bacillus sp. AFS015802]|uniref:restriction endonuclease subunit S n=1 Tax=Bacillus sp. AFS015802 TaxID=2033486 RepID=UPI000BF83BF0|nr:restriction endonuclease subunit S [Bacillus sp. AFS015802]PFA68762.1 hypothetical protein CN378_06025 [Bacillus sp. AFS015802]